MHKNPMNSGSTVDTRSRWNSIINSKADIVSGASSRGIQKVHGLEYLDEGGMSASSQVYTGWPRRGGYMYIYIYTYMAAPQNIGPVTWPGGLFATRLVTESRGIATNPPRDRPIEDYSTLHTGPRQGFVTEGPRQMYVTEGVEGPRQTSIWSHSSCNYMHKYMLFTNTYIYVYPLMGR